jgi:hypothetical protein
LARARHCEGLLRNVLSHDARGLLCEILADFSNDGRVQGLRQCSAEQTEECRGCHQNNTVELAGASRSLEFLDNLVREVCRLMLARGPLAAGAVMPDRSAPTAGSCRGVKHTARPVGFEVAIVEVPQRI